MLKRDKADAFYSVAIKRYQKERPNVKLTKELLDGIWFSIYGILCHEGEEAADEYVQSAKLLEK